MRFFVDQIGKQDLLPWKKNSRQISIEEGDMITILTKLERSYDVVVKTKNYNLMLSRAYF